MALPLLLAGAAGILGGGRYLLNKEDERKAANTRAGLESFLASSALPQATKFGILNNLQTSQQNASGGLGGFLDTGQNQRAQSLMDYAMQADAQYRGAQQQQAMAQQQQFRQSNQGAIADIRGVRESGSQRFNNVQRVMQFGESLLKSDAFSQNDLYAMVFQFAEALAPEDRKTNEDIQNIIDNTPLLASAWNQIGKITGKANREIGEDIFNTMQRLYNVERGQYNTMMNNTKPLIESYRQQGFAQDPRKYTGLWGVNQGYQPSGVQAARPRQAQQAPSISNKEYQALVDAGMDPIRASQVIGVSR